MRTRHKGNLRKPCQPTAWMGTVNADSYTSSFSTSTSYFSHQHFPPSFIFPFTATFPSFSIHIFLPPYPHLPPPSIPTSSSSLHTHIFLLPPHPHLHPPSTPTSSSSLHTHIFFLPPHPHLPPPSTLTSSSSLHTHIFLPSPHPTFPRQQAFIPFTCV
ncbi:hypothetical protein Pcinc_041802 [Petrolisthes cinctipes]|uniref:Uncharacterized protein n=1 Tax=Petrolisthes cinctipes TaxID=88211 RepID=A0AAE1EGK0_PETCI|nr:hypothetical protein Pcinc_041802 [Petrolisthes cinctipes]